MSKTKNLVSKDIISRDFIYLELAKRHVEEYHPEVIEYLINTQKKFHEKYSIDYYMFFLVISQILDMYNLRKQGLEYKTSNYVKELLREFPQFDNYYKKGTYLQEQLDQMLIISNKYDIPAPEILYPIDMYDILKSYSDSYCPPKSYRFRNIRNTNFNTVKSIYEVITMPISKTLSESDIDDMKYQHVLNRVVNDKYNTEDINFINSYGKNEYKNNFSATSFFKLALGIFIWDLKKNNRDKNEALNLYKNYKYNKDMKSQHNNNKNICNKSCGSSKISVCPNRQSCQSHINEAYRLTSLDIEKCDFLGSKTKGDAVKPKSKINLKRYNVSFYEKGIE